MLGKIHLESLLQRASEKRVYTDVFFLLTLLTLSIFVLGGKTRLFGTLVCGLVFVFLYNETTVQQFFSRTTFDDERDELRLENTTTNLQLPSIARLGLHIPLIVSGVVQSINRTRRDETYALTRELAASLISQTPNSIVYRSLSHRMPRKVIYLMQHVTAVLDNFTFLQFIPEGYRFRVLNKSNANPLGLFPKSSRKYLFGAHFLEMESPEKLRESVRTFVQCMVEDQDPTIYCIWPSGKLWEKNIENGVREFKLGAFYMSCYTGIPITFVHTKVQGLVKNIIVEQTPLIHPPKIEPREADYMQFYHNTLHKPTVVEFRDKIEKLYRELDNHLDKEID